MLTPRYQTRGHRLDLKRKVRNTLGPQSTGAATTRDTLVAARWMASLVSLATGGQLRLILARPDGSPVDWADAVADASRSDIL